MSSIVVVGSGASGVHFALSALRRGHRVTMLDVGYTGAMHPAADATFPRLKEELEDPVAYFAGPQLENVVFPGPVARHYGFPPSKRYVFAHPSAFALATRGFDPMISFARGGLAEAWTGGCYELNDSDLRAFPVSAAELQPYYSEIVRRIGVSGVRDDVARFSPFTAPYLDALPLDGHSERLLSEYDRHRARLHGDSGFYLGRSRVATLSRDLGERKACAQLGRCLWGCPRRSLYAPSMTLGECLAHEAFDYVPGQYVRYFEYEGSGRVTRVIADDSQHGGRREYEGDVLVLAAGTLGSSYIYLASILRREGRAPTLGGLMDNAHGVIPFVTPAHLGAPLHLDAYQFHLLAFGLEGSDGEQEAHGQITTLRAASVHPIVQNLPMDLRSGLATFRRIRPALGVANVWRAGTRLAENTVTVRAGDGDVPALELHCRTDDASHEAMQRTIGRVRRALGMLGSVAPAGMAQVLPLGSSAHYVGTIPMRGDDDEHSCAPSGRVRGFRNLVIADGATFPALPAKNLTLTLMANAARLADLLPDRE